MAQVDAKKTSVWLDCDPGHDDAMAILLAAYTSKLELIGISTVAGNQSLEKITHNALDVLNAINITVPVIAGASMPLVRDHKSCPEIHGESGLDGPRGGKLLPPHPPSYEPIKGKAIVMMAEAIEEVFKRGNGSKVKLACTGPLTNAALLLTVYPEVIPMIDLVLMGGSVFAGGNISASAEFNIQVDPEAAKVVFESGVSLVMVPLDVTHKVLCTPGVLERVAGIECTETLEQQLVLSRISSIWRRQTEEEIANGTKEAYYKIVDSSKSKFRAAIAELLLFFAETYRKEHGFAHPPLHDPLTIAYIIDPSKFVVEPMHVEIETMSPSSYGTTICDRRMKTTHPHNTTVCLEVDMEWFWSIMIEAVGEADKVSPMNV
jgi:inosine-uridine nucleoside N-ribohydrolase